MDERGIGASQLATYLHVSHVSVGNWLKGTYLPEVPNIIKIARYFKVDPDYLLQAFNAGADGVLVLGCPRDNCKSTHGNVCAQWAVEQAQELLA